jgi:hypothetical protein
MTRWLFRIGALFLGVLIEAAARVVDKFADGGALVATLRGAVILGLIIWVWHATRERKPSPSPADPTLSTDQLPAPNANVVKQVRAVRGTRRWIP